MKGFSIVAAAGLLSLSTLAQSQSPAAENRGSNSVKTGNPAPEKTSFFFIVAEFTQSINAGKLKPGAKIKAQVTQDVLSHGRIVIPEDSKLIGHVTEARGRGREDQESRLGIVFDKIVLKNHREVDFQGVIQRLEPPAIRRSKVDEPDQMMPPSFPGSSHSLGLSPGGGRGSGMGSSPPNLVSNQSADSSVYVNGTPGSNAGNSAGGDLSHPSGGMPANPAAVASPLGVGMPQGISGLKGLSLSPGPSSNTPGPVITSSTRDVKLEYGTQVLVKGSNPHLAKP